MKDSQQHATMASAVHHQQAKFFADKVTKICTSAAAATTPLHHPRAVPPLTKLEPTMAKLEPTIIVPEIVKLLSTLHCKN